jgi:hypothetical protein
MGNEVLDAIIGAVSALIVCVITIFFDGKRRKRELEDANKQLEQSIKREIELNQKSLAIQYVTDKRVDWICTVREELSNFISISFLLEQMCQTEDNIDKELFAVETCKRNKSLSQLRLLFNINDELDSEILQALNDIVSTEYTSEEFIKAVNILTQKSKIYLKIEWERVKLEAKSSLNDDEIKTKLKEKEIELREFFNQINELEECQ